MLLHEAHCQKEATCFAGGLLLRYQNKKIVLGGVEARLVESQILTRFPEIDIIAY